MVSLLYIQYLTKDRLDNETNQQVAIMIKNQSKQKALTMFELGIVFRSTD